MKRILVLLILCVVTLPFIGITSAETYVDKDTFFHSTNVIFNTTKDLLFENVSAFTDHVTFNDSAFYITPTNPANISIQYLAPNIIALPLGATVMQFFTNDSSGLAYINISGFLAFTTYSVYMNSTFQLNVISTASGFVNFTSNVWNRYIEVYVGAGALPPGGGGRLPQFIPSDEEPPDEEPIEEEPPDEPPDELPDEEPPGDTTTDTQTPDVITTIMIFIIGIIVIIAIIIGRSKL